MEKGNIETVEFEKYQVYELNINLNSILLTKEKVLKISPGEDLFHFRQGNW